MLPLCVLIVGMPAAFAIGGFPGVVIAIATLGIAGFLLDEA